MRVKLRIYVFTLLPFLFLTHPLQSVISPIVTLAPLLQERGIFGLFRKQTVLGGELSLEQHKLFGSNTIPSTLSGKRIEFLAERFFSFSGGFPSKLDAHVYSTGQLLLVLPLR